MKRPLPNTYWVIEGRFLAGEYPGGESASDTRKRLAKLREAGIDSFIDLTEADERDSYRELLPPEVDYYRRPFPDHGVPSDPAAMSEVLAVLRKALAADRNVYLHCRAGIGRTGMTVACHLAESGALDGEQALARLNELWQQNARAARWPVVPETDEQTSFVLKFRPAGSSAAGGGATLASASSTRLPALGPAGAPERARGALLGLAVADALAVGLEGGAPPAQFTGGGPDDLPPGAWTDETAMALCLADSLLACGRVDTRDQAERYMKWLREGHRAATGVAAGVRPELRRSLALAATRHSALNGTHDPRVLDAEPLARCAPAVIFFYGDPTGATEAAADAARVTHQAPIVVDACRLFAAMLLAALTGVDRGAVLAQYRRWESTLQPEVLAVAQGWQRLGAAAVRPRGAILQTLDGVVRSFAAAKDFRSGLTALLTQPQALRGESDVAAAAYGQLAGAFFGERGIPRDLREGLVAAGEIADLATRLLPTFEQSPEAIPQGLHSR